MTTPLQDVLARRFGVDEAAFAAALEEFAERIGSVALVDIRPAAELGEPRQAALRKLGATLQPLRSNEMGPIAALAAAYAELAATSITVARAARRLGVDTSRIRQRIYARSLYAFKDRGVWLVPAFQIEGRTIVPGLDVVVPALPPSLHPVAVSRWFTTRSADLTLGDAAVAPLEWLSAGGPPDRVAALAGGLDRL